MLLRELYEDTTKKAVLAFGRLNPPTIGHAKLVDTIKGIEGDHYLFLSQSQKPKTDPLDFATKVKFAKQFFPGINIGHQSVRTPVQALEMLQSLGYTDVVFIAGSDRVEGFQKLFDTYNGKADKSGNIPFEFNSIRVVSAGERDPDADDVSGMSASKMRAAAAVGDLDTFAKGVPNAKLAKTMFDAVRKGMGVTEPVTQEDASPEQEYEFHKKLDKLVHKTFGMRPEEKKKKKVKESNVVVDKGHLVPYLKNMIMDYLDKEEDIDKLSRILKMMVGKEIKARGKRFLITGEDILEALRTADLKTTSVYSPKTKSFNPHSPNPKNAPKKKDPFDDVFDEGGEAADFDMDPEDIAKRKPVPVPGYYKDKGVKSWKQMPKLKVQDENPPRGIHKA